MTYAEILAEVKRRAARDQGGTQYDTAAKQCINTSLLRVSRETCWRSMRRKTTFDTKATYSTGTGAGTFTKDSANITVTGAKFITDGIEIGRYIKLSGDGKYHTIKNITSETAITLQRTYSGTSTAVGTYQILGQEQYNLPIQSGHRMFLWHNEYGFPMIMRYYLDQDFYRATNYVYMQQIPLIYRMWGEDMIQTQIRTASVVKVVSSSTADTSKPITVFGTVAGYPDSETITTNGSDGTTAVSGTKSFQSVERISKNATTTGRITITANTDTDTLAVIPAGEATWGIQYKKVQIWPLPTTAFPMNVQYYKDPYKLVGDYDVHELGADFDEAIILLSVAKIRLDNNQEEADKYYTLYKDEIQNLKKTNVDKIDWFPKLERPFSSNAVLNGRGLLYAQAGPMFGVASQY